MRVAVGRSPRRGGIVASGRLRLRGPLATPRALLTAEAEVRDLLVSLPDYPVQNRAPLHLRLADGTLEVRRLELSGEGTDLAVAGTAALVGDGALDLTVRGSGRPARALAREHGAARPRGGARRGRRWRARAPPPWWRAPWTSKAAGVRLRGFPHGVEDVRGRVLFDGHSAHFSGMTGTVGGGPVELEGQAAYTGGRLTSFDVQGSGRSIALRYPEGLRSVLDADLRFFGDDAAAVAHGQGRRARRGVDAPLRRRLGAPGRGRAGGRPRPASAAACATTSRSTAPGTLKIDNNLATLQARADLTLQGSYAAPVVLGRAEIDRGRVYFQGNTYVIRRGTIDFTNPQRLDPLFDVEAETRVRSYNVILKVNGTLERVYPTLSSDPPLSTVGILSLLAGAGGERGGVRAAAPERGPPAGRTGRGQSSPRASSRSRWGWRRGRRASG